MPTYIARRDTPLLRKPVDGADRLGMVPKDTKFAGEKDKDNPDFIKTTISSISPDAGFIEATPFAVRQIVTPVPIAPENAAQFCDLVTQAAREVGADRDYLMAVAYDATNNLKAPGDAATPRPGPFRIGADVWKKAIEAIGEESGFTEEDRLDWLQQPKFAAFLAKEATAKFNKTVGRLPTFRELYFMQLAGDAALEGLQTPTMACDVRGDPADDTYAIQLKNGTKTVNDALTDLQGRLERAFAEALKVIDEQPAENRFMRASADDAPWMAVAREQMSRGVSETPDRRNPEEVAAYFKAINAFVGTTPGDTTPWCGAFVGYCVKNCGVAEAAGSVDANAVGVGFWSTWGTQAPNPPPVGSIVILNGGGHVGFLAEGASATKVKILGGNQGGGGAGPDRVGIVEFNRPGPNDFRWRGNVQRVIKPRIEAGDGLFVEMAPRIMRRLSGDFTNLNEVHLAAILGNLGHECAGFTTMQEIRPIGGGAGGLGWAQWTGSRRTSFERWKAQLPDNDFERNYTFLLNELTSSHKRAISDLLKHNDIHGAVVAFELVFEIAHPAFKHYERRERYAQIALSEYRKSATS